MSAFAMQRGSALGEVADELRESVHAFVTARSPESEVRRLMESDEGHDPAVWRQMADQLELQGMCIPAELGGAGFALDAQTVVFEEMGAALMCTPYLSTALACEALLASRADPAATRELPLIAKGERLVTVAIYETTGKWDLDSARTSVESNGASGWKLSGEKVLVLDGCTADLFVVSAKTPSGVGLFAVEGAAPGVSRQRINTLDPTRRQASVRFDGADAEQIGDETTARAALERVDIVAAVALSAEAVGAAGRCLDMSVEYAKDRVQFGRPIGSFQAIKHKCAEMLRLTEQSRSATYEAARLVTDGDAAAAVTASVAKAYASEACAWVAAENIQVHGGIGFTWEHSAHLYLRRVKSNEQLFGGPAHHRQLLLMELGI